MSEAVKDRLSYAGEFRGTVDESGKLRFDDPIGWSGRMAQMRGKRVLLTVETDQPRRSTEANARYWSVIVPLARHRLSRDRVLPLSKEETHYVLASAFAGTEESALGVPIPVKTRKFTKEQFHTYCMAIEAWLGQEGYPVPQPGERVEALLEAM